MTLVWIVVAVLVVATVAVLVLGRKPAARPAPIARRDGRAADAPMHERRATPAAATPAGAAWPVATSVDDLAAAAAAAIDAPVPDALAGLDLVLADALDAERKARIVEAFREVPRPPKLLQHLLSPEFVNAASAGKLVDLIAGEPLIAAKVLGAVNSPMYGLQSPVSSIGQAVSYLGLNTVRTLCLQYLLIASFQADSAERKQRVDVAWAASALASELTHQVAQRLALDDRGSLVSAVVLSFLGRLATTATMPRETLAALPSSGFLDRTVAEQAALGLSAGQIGRLLMQAWELPASLVDEASAVDSVLVAPDSSFATEDQATRLAICYLCARAGERLAEGTLDDLTRLDPLADGDAELFRLRSYLGRAKVARAVQVIRSPELAGTMRTLRAALRR